MAALLSSAVPAMAQAGATSNTPAGIQVESRVLPVGTKVPSLAQLQKGSVRQEFAQQPGLAPSVEGQLPAETVGPVRAHGPVATERSAVAVPGDLQAKAVTYPEPARTMTAAECQKGLGTDKKFYIKSRFAVCSGALFHQIWTKNGRPVGESQFVVLVVGTTALDSREVRFTHYFTSMAKTGSTKTSALMISPKVTVPLMYPKKAKHTFSGSVPGMRSWDAVKANSSFQQTMTVAPGQGAKGSTDLVESVYQPSISLKFPTGVKGDTSGDLFLLPPRWDAAKYLRNSTGGGKPDKRGAAAFAVVATLHYSAKAGAAERAVAQHIQTAFTHPEKTEPYMSAKDVPGRVPAKPLNRLYEDTNRADTNRRRAVAQCKRFYGDYAKAGKECDEYPFASTYQGAAQSEYDPEAKKFNFSVKAIPKADNKAGGDLLKGFYGKNRMLDGTEDGFIVAISS
ncbi:NucA/NucB deoxyribonuclease domain-containing protein [Streptomyces ochraceiscleroticus]|uniref:NucA/NucB deoxyribonuclease domain-containing protein n=2 Tax=Streptomyces ochraceiscleroticus TaxID=47761 RepID=A0ABW1MKI4_9ACTN